MKKNLFFASIFVAGAATVSVAQLSANNTAASFPQVGAETINLQDTTKPVKDTVPPKKDSTSVKY